MANPRLPFLYPNFFRSVKTCEPVTYRSIRTPPRALRSGRAGLHTSQRRAQDTFHQRYGPAAEPQFPPPSKPKEPILPIKPQQPKKEAAKTEQGEKEAKSQPSKDTEVEARPVETEKKDAGSMQDGAQATLAKEKDAESQPNKELDMVLQIPTPSEEKRETEKHPHLAASPYEHHFDTYSLVQELAKDGFTQDQAVTVMKAIRSMLAVNLDLAKEGLVSKSDTENVTYLFRAACSELRTTLQTSRQTEIQRKRSQRAHLQHEADILSQKMTQDLMTLKEEMKAMFHNRKMAVQEQKSNLDGKISELNYEITVLLNSDAKSEVEGLRWVLARRAVMAIAIVACKLDHPCPSFAHC